jgi:aminoglycoside phosphotransferase (APT) family kinase protein
VSEQDLAADLRAVLGADDVVGLVRLSGGASRETWSFDAVGPGPATRRLILQRRRPGSDNDMDLEARVLRAARAGGVPAPDVVAWSGDSDALGAPFTIVERVDGETIARKILRDDDFAAARPRLAADLGRAAAALHTIDPASVPGLQLVDELELYRQTLDASGQPHPAFELAFRWLDANRPDPMPPAIVHGDFRLGNIIVGPDGLRAVIDWELAHIGEPLADLGWMCVKAWRYRAPGRVAGVGDVAQLLGAYEDGSGTRVDPEVLRWWEVFGTLKWGVICIMQADVHLSGASRSHELAAIGRRVCENEYDLLLVLP